MGVRVPPFAGKSPMNYKVEKLSETKRKLVLTVPAEDVEREYRRIVREFAKRGKIPGFRPGKAPLEVVEKVFKKEIEDALLDELLIPRLQRALEEVGARPVRSPVLKEWRLEKGKPVELVAEYEEIPEFEVKDYKGVKVSSRKVEVKEEDVDAAVERLRQRMAKYTPVEREVRPGDYVMVNLSLQDKETKRRLPMMRLAVVASDKGDGLEAKVVGKKPGETFSYEESYPENYPDRRLAGRTFIHEVKIVEAREVSLPPLDDEFARSLFNFESLQQLREKLKKDIEEELEREERLRVKREIMDKIMEKNPVAVPEVLVEEEYRELVREQMNEWARTGRYPGKQEWEELSKKLKEAAEKNVRTDIILQKIASQEKLEPTEEEVDERIRRIAEEKRISYSELRDYLEKKGYIEDIRQQLSREKALDFIYSQAIIKIEEEKSKT